MGIMVYSLLWVVQDLYHQPHCRTEASPPRFVSIRHFCGFYFLEVLRVLGV